MTDKNGLPKNTKFGANMAKIKNEVDKKPKTKSLFDHLNEIRVGKNPKYFETLSETDKKTWSNYMVCRFLSMQMEFVDSINDLQYYQDKLTPEQFYRICITVVPKAKVFVPYIKNSKEKYNKSLLTLLSIHFKDSERNVVEYMSLMTNDDIRSIVQNYGYSAEQADELLETGK
jgi:hypothetical protein